MTCNSLIVLLERTPKNDRVNLHFSYMSFHTFFLPILKELSGTRRCTLSKTDHDVDNVISMTPYERRFQRRSINDVSTLFYKR